MIENILYPSREPYVYAIRKLIPRAIILTLLAWSNIAALQTAYAQDGATLHTENCIACHAAMTGGDGSVLYTRDDRSVKSPDALTKQVNRCQSSLELNWSSNQIDSVQQYINSSYYLF